MSHPDFSNLELPKGQGFFGPDFGHGVQKHNWFTIERKRPEHPGATFGPNTILRRKFLIAQVIRNFRRNHSGWTSSRDSILRELCEEHLSYTRLWTPSDCRRALKEIIELSINDPHLTAIYRSFDLRYLRNEYDERDLQVLASKMYASLVGEGVHTHWRKLIASRFFETRDPEKPNPELTNYRIEICNNCKLTLSDPKYSFLGARYLARGLGSSPIRDGIGHRLELWRQYIKTFALQPNLIEASIFETCIKNLFESQLALKFFPPNELGILAGILMRNARNTRIVFTTFFTSPTIRPHQVKDTGELQVECWNSDQLPSYCLQFFGVLCHSENIEDHLAYIRKMENKTRETLGDTVLISELWVMFSHLALDGYRYGPGFPSREGPSKRNWPLLWDVLPRLIEHLHSDLPSDRDLATYLLARFSRMDRYRKLALTHFVSPQWIEDIRADVGRPKWPRLVMFDNVPYLKRFRVGGQVLFVTSDYLPERHHEMEQLDVDTMSLSGDAVLWLSVNGDGAPFDTTGHYPILAGYDSLGNPLYVAAARLEFLCYFAPVAEGASTLTYQDELGDEHVSHDFFVLALRHNPFDISPPHPRARAGAMDPTGPLYWLRCWPERDPEYFEDELLEGDDRRFESALSGITSWGVADSERTKFEIGDTVLEDGVDSDIAKSL